MLWTILKDEFRFLTFRRMSPAVRENRRAYLLFGLFFTWLAGIGRYWDNAHGLWWQQLGLGSLAYVFVLSAILWLIVWPLRPENWSFRNVLLFVTLTAPPALLYAYPSNGSCHWKPRKRPMHGFWPSSRPGALLFMRRFCSVSHACQPSP